MNYFEKMNLLMCLLFQNERWELNSKLILTNHIDLSSLKFPRGGVHSSLPGFLPADDLGDTWKVFLFGTEVLAVLFDPKGNMEDQTEIVAFVEVNLRI